MQVHHLFLHPLSMFMATLPLQTVVSMQQVQAVALDFEGKRAFVGDVEGVIRVFDAADGKPLGELPSNPPTVAVRLERLDAQLAELAKAQPPDPAKIDPLKAARKRWGAADILTKTLGAEAALSTANQEADARFDGFSTAGNPTMFAGIEAWIPNRLADSVRPNSLCLF